MNAARLQQSPRLQRVLAVLSDHKPHTTRDLVLRANVCAVNSVIAELRANGLPVECECLGRGLFAYRLVQERAAA